MSNRERVLRCAALALATFIALPLTLAPAASGLPPPGATARCVDGTYSFSRHHSGTCSHHGGVANWLDGRTSSAGKATTTTSGGTSNGGGPIDVGKTILLKRRTRTSNCTLGALPDRRCSPGAYYTKLTKRVICSADFRTSSIRNVPTSEKHAVEMEYGLAPRGYGSTMEIDHIVSLELGGSNDISNLFPEKAAAHPGFHVKDKLENKVKTLVCAGQITLRAARQQIAANWERLYRKVYGVAPAR